MCNFMGVKVSLVEFIRLKHIERELGTLAAMAELEILKSGFAYSNSLIIRKSAENEIDLVSAHWEFIPPWIADEAALKEARKKGIPWLNARGETLLESKMFRSAALKRRCLVLASHFFEWRHHKPDGAKKEIAYPYIIEHVSDDYFFMAGIWQPWTDKETGETIDTFAIVTTEANELMSTIHNTKKRMPTILPEDLAWEWIMEDISEDQLKEIACYQLPSEMLHAHTIAKNFKEPGIDPTLEVEYDELPDLDLAI